MIQADPFPEYRAILCAECGEEALVIHSSTPASSVEGRRQRCECCGTEGKVVLLDDENPSLTQLEFRSSDQQPFCRCETCVPGNVTCVSRELSIPIYQEIWQ